MKATFFDFNIMTNETAFDETDEEFEFDNNEIENSENIQDSENEGEMEGDANQPIQKTADQVEKIQQARKEQKALLKERKEAKPNAPIIINAKAIWENLRKRNLGKSERASLMEKMMDLVSGKCKDIIFKVIFTLNPARC